MWPMSCENPEHLGRFGTTPDPARRIDDVGGIPAVSRRVDMALSAVMHW